MTTIDIHPHVISTDETRYKRAPVGGHQSDWSRERPVSTEQMIAAMDAAGVQKSALVQASTCYGHDNSYVVDAVAAHPDRFTGVFSVDVLAPDAVEKMRHWMGKGLTGLRLFTTGSTMPNQATWLDDQRSFPAWEFAGEVNLPICVQMGPPGLPMLTKLLERFPKVRVILDHLGRADITDGPPYTAAAGMFDLARYPQLYLKITPRTFEGAQSGKSDPKSFFAKLVGEFGASRVAWGSNFPASAGTLAELLAAARKSLSSLPEQDRAWIFAKTAESLYPALAAK